MKKLTNISPFILLLVPVFVLMILTFTTTKELNEKIVLKTASPLPALKVSASWAK